MARMTDQEVMKALRADTALNRARAIFSSAYAGIEQEGMQRKPAGPIEIRRMEFEAVEKIAAALGVGVRAPYPFCRTPDKCAGKGYCPQEIACND